MSRAYAITVTANVPASLNRVLRWHHTRKTRERGMWQNAIVVLLGQRRLKELRQLAGTGERMWVRITIFNPRRYDTDNAHGACKLIFDAIVRLGLAKDDREEHMLQLVEQQKVPGKEKRTLIEIGALDGERKQGGGA